MSSIDEEFVTRLIQVHREAAEELEKIRDEYLRRKEELQRKPAPVVPARAVAAPVVPARAVATPATSDAKDKPTELTKSVRARKTERQGRSQKTGTGIGEKQFTTRESGSGNSTETGSNRRAPSVETRHPVDPLSLKNISEAHKDSETSRPPSQRGKLKVMTTVVQDDNTPRPRAPSARRHRP